MGYAGPKANSKVNMILKDKTCKHGLLGNPLKKKKVKPSKAGAEAMIKAREENVKPKVSKPTPSVSEFVASRTTPPTKKKHNSGGMYKKGCKYGKK